METWSYQDITDREFMLHQAKAVEQCRGKVRLNLHDGDLIVGKRMAVVNLFFMQVLKAFNIPVCKRHWIKRRPFNGSTTASAWNQYYLEIVQPNPKNAKAFKRAVWDAMQDLYSFTSINLLPWSCSIDGVDISEIVTDPKMEKIIQTKETFKPELGSKAAGISMGISNICIMIMSIVVLIIFLISIKKNGYKGMHFGDPEPDVSELIIN